MSGHKTRIAKNYIGISSLFKYSLLFFCGCAKWTIFFHKLTISNNRPLGDFLSLAIDQMLASWNQIIGELRLWEQLNLAIQGQV